MDPDVIRDISDRYLDLQRPIRVLQSVKWDDTVEAAFLADDSVQPPVDREYYAARPLSFDPAELRAAFAGLAVEVAHRLGADTPVGQLLSRGCQQYQVTIDLLESRGTADFGRHGAELYGAADDPFHEGGPSSVDLAMLFHESWEQLRDAKLDPPGDIPAADAVGMLQAQLDRSLGPDVVEVRLDDGIVSDAAAGSNYIKLRDGAHFNAAQLDQLEAHEGWVHVATTQNGLAQRACTFLGRATPPTTVTQEGLATLTEIVSMRSNPARLHRIAERIDGIHQAASGATFLDVYRQFRSDGTAKQPAYRATMRIFRGSTPTGPPFHKDLAYGRGLVQTYAYLRVAVREARLDRIPSLFAGKLDLADIGLINRLLDESVIDPPKMVPPPFANPAALVASTLFSRFLPELDFDVLAAEFVERL